METKLNKTQLSVLRSMNRGLAPTKRVIAKLDSKVAELLAQKEVLVEQLNTQIAAMNSYAGVEDYTVFLQDPTVPTTDEELPNLPFVEAEEVVTHEHEEESVVESVVEDTIWG